MYFVVRANNALEPVYIKRQRQRCDNSVTMLVILFSLKTVESLENVLHPQSGTNPIPDFGCEPYSVNAVVKIVVKFK